MILLWLVAGCGPSESVSHTGEEGLAELSLSGVELGFYPDQRNYAVLASNLSAETTVVATAGRRRDRVVLRLETSTGELIADDVSSPLALVGNQRLEVDVIGDEVMTWSVSIVPDDLPPLTASGIDSGLSFFLTPRDYTAEYPASGYGGYLMVVDGRGIPIWWRERQGLAYDFRPAADGTWTANAKLDDAAELEAVRLDPVTGSVVDRWQPLLPDGWDEVLTDPHELLVMADGSTLQSIAGTGAMDLTSVGGSQDGRVHHSGIQERDPSGGLTAEWTTEGAVDLDLLPADVQAAEAFSGPWRYAHINSVDLTEDGWLVSLRSPGEVLRVRRDTGEIVWRLGGPQSDFTFVGDSRNGFFGQHSARWGAGDRVLLFDNVTNMGSPATGDARAVEYVLDEAAGTATLTFEYDISGAGGAEFAGSVERLVDGRLVVSFGSIQTYGDGRRAPTIAVFGEQGELVSQLALPEGLYTYRVWTGARF